MAPQIVWCDAKDCIYHEEELGECDVYRLKVEGGVCVGHPRSGRNVTSNDVVERLRELVRLMIERDAMLLCCHGCTPYTCKAYGSDLCGRIARLSDELGIEVDE